LKTKTINVNIPTFLTGLTIRYDNNNDDNNEILNTKNEERLYEGE
jgi:hypothetical protein